MMARRVMAGRGGFNPKALFSANEQGVWYDPSDFSTLFQDAAGTTPVTAIEQPVGKILDKSGRGNHAAQSSNSARPTLKQDATGKYYLLFTTNNYLYTINTVNLTSTNKLTYWLAMTRLSNSAFEGEGNILTFRLSNTASGQFGFVTPLFPNQPNTALAFSGGTAFTNSSLFTYYLNEKAIFCASADIGAPYLILRKNATQLYNVTDTQGTGNYGNYNLNINSRWDFSLRVNCTIYQIIVRGAQTPANLITATERYVARKTGVTL